MTREEAARIITVILDCCKGKDEDYEKHEIIPLEKSFKALSMAIKALQQEPKRGKWYIREYEFFTCDQCGEDVLSFAESTSEAKRKLKNGDFPNYCPDCGARME